MVSAPSIRQPSPRRFPQAQAFSRAGLALVALVGLALGGCDPGYPIEPTACDDWCRVTQRASCSEDYPEGCVSECEDRQIGRRFPQCEEPWLALAECYRRAPDSDFLCVEDESRPSPICIDERVAVMACAFPLRGRCLEVCLREARDCERPELRCEPRCRSPANGCEVPEQALYDCQLREPVDCQDPATDRRDATDIPCIAEIDALLKCAGFYEATARVPEGGML